MPHTPLAPLSLCLFALFALACARSPQPGPDATPASIADGDNRGEPSARYLFYLHGKIVEGSDGRPRHPRFGIYQYPEIVAALRANGLEIVSEVRPAGVQIMPYARQVADEVEELIAAGVAPGDITVAGHSRGGAIAVYTSAILDRSDVNFVFLACCGRWQEAPDAPRVRGRILSIYEASDELGRSCRPTFERAREGTVHDELEIAIGGGHGAFFRPDPAWVDPLVRWAEGER